MVLDAKVLRRPLEWAAPSGAGGLDGSGDLLAQASVPPEGERERAERVRRLAEQVRGGSYAVHAGRLALALLEWDPRRSVARQSHEGDDRRRTYMRDYMRRRRAARMQDEAAPAPL